MVFKRKNTLPISNPRSTTFGYNSWKSALVIGFVVLAAITGQAKASTITLTFDALPTGLIAPFTENGYSITWHGYPNNTYSQAIQNVGGTNQNVVVDGTPSNVYGTAVSITRIDGALFDVVSLDIANLSGSVSNNDLRVGEEGEPGTPGPTYESYYPFASTFVTVNPGLTNVSSFYVDLITYGGTQHAVDNIVLSSPIPEPSAALLFALGLVGFEVRRRAIASTGLPPLTAIRKFDWKAIEAMFSMEMESQTLKGQLPGRRPERPIRLRKHQRHAKCSGSRALV